MKPDFWDSPAGFICFLAVSPIILITAMAMHFLGGMVALLTLPWKR